MTRGDLWWADFGLPFGSEPGFRRPVLIVQGDAYTRSRLNTVIVGLLSTNLALVVTHLSALDKERLLERAGRTSRETMEAVESGVRMVLGLA